jgi:cytochrome c peroxidase
MRRRVLLAAVAVGLLIGGALLRGPIGAPPPWSEEEKVLLRSLWIGSLPPPPADPSNAVADDPAAARLGERLFFDTRLSATGAVSCATCHQPALGYTDGAPRARGIGMTRRHTPGIAAASYSPWLYWDGRKSSVWAQALAPLEDPVEHGAHRTSLARLMVEDDAYRNAVEAIFGSLPDPTDPEGATRLFVHIGKALAAYQRLIRLPETRFDHYVAAVLSDDPDVANEIFDQDEVRGLRLFVGPGQCIQCHNGPLLTNHEFHNTGVLSAPGQQPDRGRIDGWRQLVDDPFNCLGAYHDDPAPACEELHFARSGPELLGAMRTPSLRNVGRTAPYMHAGQIVTLTDVIRHYDEAPAAMIGHNEIKPLRLGRRQRAYLEAFLHTLDGPPDQPFADPRDAR